MSPPALRRAVERLGVPAVIFFSLVTLAAGISAILLLGWPGSTGRTFSWTLRPPAAAALIGGFYLASSVIFGIGLTRPWTEVRAICVAVYGLVIPTLVETFVHLPVFEFSRWQALLWVALFVAAPLAITYVLWSQRERPSRPVDRSSAGRAPCWRFRPWCSPEWRRPCSSRRAARRSRTTPRSPSSASPVPTSAPGARPRRSSADGRHGATPGPRLGSRCPPWSPCCSVGYSPRSEQRAQSDTVASTCRRSWRSPRSSRLAGGPTCTG